MGSMQIYQFDETEEQDDHTQKCSHFSVVQYKIVTVQ